MWEKWITSNQLMVKRLADRIRDAAKRAFSGGTLEKNFNGAISPTIFDMDEIEDHGSAPVADAAVVERVEMEEDLRQWLVNTDTEERRQWARQAHARWRRRFGVVPKFDALRIDKVLYLLVLFDSSVLTTLENLLMLENIVPILQSICLTDVLNFGSQIRYDQTFHRDWMRNIPASAEHYVATAIGRVLSKVEDAVDLTIDGTPLAFAASITASLQSIKTWRFCQIHLAEHTSNDMAALAESIQLQASSLESVLLSVSFDVLRVAGPSFLTLPKLSNLVLHGHLDQTLIDIRSVDDVVVINGFLTNESLREVTLVSVRVESEEAASYFCEAIRASKLNKLNLRSLTFPAIKEADLVQSLADSRIRELYLFAQVSEGAMLKFAPAFAASKTSAMVSLCVGRSYTVVGRPVTAYVFLDKSAGEKRTRGLPEEWVASVTRTLDIHRQQESSLPTFETFLKTHKSPELVRFADVFAVHPVIVFEYMRHDKFALLKAIQDFHPVAK